MILLNGFIGVTLIRGVGSRARQMSLILLDHQVASTVWVALAVLSCMLANLFSKDLSLPTHACIAKRTSEVVLLSLARAIYSKFQVCLGHERLDALKQQEVVPEFQPALGKFEAAKLRIPKPSNP